MSGLPQDGAADSRAWSPPEFLDELSTGGQPELVAELIETFLEDSVRRLQALDDGWMRGDLASVRAQAHSLKGSCGQMGADSMAQLCHTMETLAREGKPAEGRALAGRLAGELMSVRAALESYRPALENVPREFQCAS